MTRLAPSPRSRKHHGRGLAILGAVGLALALAAAAPAHAASYKLIDLGTLPGGTTSVPGGINGSGQVAGRGNGSAGNHAFLGAPGVALVDLGTLAGFNTSAGNGLNDAGHVVGGAMSSTGAAHAFLLVPGSPMQDLGTLPGGFLSVAFGVNGLDEVVGWGDSPAASQRAFRWTAGGGMTDLLGANANTSLAHAINDAGDVVGVADGLAFLLRAGTFTSLGTLPDGGSSEARGVSANGLIVGWSSTLDGSNHGALWEGSAVTDLGLLPGGSFSDAYGVNSLRQVVGVADVADGTKRAFLWDGGAMTDLGTLPGGTFSWAYGINEAGQIVGVADNASHQQHAVVWQPNAAPVATSQSVSTKQDTALPITLAASDPDGDPLTWSVVSAPAHGSLSGTPPSVVYTPAPGYTGADSFMFVVDDGTTSSAPATVGITVASVAPPNPPQGGDPGRMTGFGFVDASGKRHLFVFYVRSAAGGDERWGRIEYHVWERGTNPGETETQAVRAGRRVSRFVSTVISTATFSDDPGFTPGRRAKPTVDTGAFSGRGKWNGTAGYTFEAKVTDAGEPGAKHDTFAITVKSPSGEVVASVNGLLTGGNIESLRVRPARNGH